MAEIKKERLLVQHTYSSIDTSRRFYARVSTKIQDNTIVCLGRKTIDGTHQSQESVNEMAESWEYNITHSIACPDNAVAFLARDTPLEQVDKSIVTSAISANDVSVSLNWLKRGKAAGPDEIPHNGYRD